MELNRRELLRIVGVVAIAWVVVLLVMATWQRSRRARGGAGAEPTLVHYPGTEGAPEQTAENLGLRKYWFMLDEAYPSKSVYQFYKREYEGRGWIQVRPGEPEWFRRREGDTAHDLFHAMWVSPDGLFQIEVEMRSPVKLIKHEGEVVSEEREPGIRVYVTLRRVMAPGLMGPPRQRSPGRGEIEVR